MAQFGRCIAAVKTAAGRELTDEEMLHVFEEAQKRTRTYQAQGMDAATAARKAGLDLSNEHRVQVAKDRADSARNKLILAREMQPFENADPKSFVQRLRSLLSGAEGNKRGLGYSIDARMKAAEEGSLAPLITDLRRANVMKAFTRRDKDFENAWAREIERPGSTGDVHARKIADILSKHLELGRLAQNKAGAMIGKVDWYLGRQSHLVDKIASVKASEWAHFIRPLLSEKTLGSIPPAEQQAWLEQIWRNLRTGDHDVTRGSGDRFEKNAAFTGSANLAKKVSQERVLHFKDAKSFIAYNDRFGTGNLADNVSRSIRFGARNAALMRALGTNPEAMWNTIIDKAKELATKAGENDEADRVEAFRKARLIDYVTGAASRPENISKARIGQNLRLLQQLRSLSGVVLSSVSDFGSMAALARHNGMPFYQGLGKAVASIVPKGASKEDRDFAEALGVGVDALLGDIAGRFTASDSMINSGRRMANLFYRYNGLEYWTEHTRAGMAAMLGRQLGQNIHKAFSSLPERYQNTLKRYGIEDAEWREIKRAEHTAEDGKKYVLPANIENEELAEKLRTFYSDQIREATNESTARTRQIATFNTRPGTTGGEIVHSLMQFKSFTINFMTRTLGRELLRQGPGWEGAGARGLWQGVKQGIDVPGLAWLAGSMTALGYVSMVMKDASKGRKPREFNDDWHNNADVLMSAAAQGGGFGLMGDFAFGERNRFGGGPLSSLMGPTYGMANDIGDAIQQARDDALEGKKWQGVESAAIRIAQNDLPPAVIGGMVGHTVPGAVPAAAIMQQLYVRRAFDFLVWNRLQEMVNPGYLARYEQRVKQQNHQEFFLSPQWNLYKAAGIAR